MSTEYLLILLDPKQSRIYVGKYTINLRGSYGKINPGSFASVTPMKLLICRAKSKAKVYKIYTVTLKKNALSRKKVGPLVVLVICALYQRHLWKTLNPSKKSSKIITNHHIMIYKQKSIQLYLSTTQVFPYKSHVFPLVRSKKPRVCLRPLLDKPLAYRRGCAAFGCSIWLQFVAAKNVRESEQSITIYMLK